MKILFISTERGWHGGEEQLRLLVEGAAAKGRDCRVAARQGGEFAERLKAAGFNVVELPGVVRGPRAIWRLRRALREFRPEVVHANDPHGLWLQRAATWGLSFPARIAARRVLFPIRSPGKYRAGCDRVLCVSHAVAKVCRESGIPDEMIKVVHEGVDPARVQAGDAGRGRASLQLADDVPIVLCVAQLAAYKGHRYLIDAWPAVLANHPSAVLVLAGDGPLRAELTSQCRELGISASVRFLGYRMDVPDLIIACDALALTSTHEGFGTTGLDAMFGNRPLVGSDAGGIAEMLRDDAGQLYGWPVPAADPPAIARAIHVVLTSPEERERRVLRARQRAESCFTAASMVERTLNAIGEALG